MGNWGMGVELPFQGDARLCAAKSVPDTGRNRQPGLMEVAFRVAGRMAGSVGLGGLLAIALLAVNELLLQGRVFVRRRLGFPAMSGCVRLPFLPPHVSCGLSRAAAELERSIRHCRGTVFRLRWRPRGADDRTTCTVHRRCVASGRLLPTYSSSRVIENRTVGGRPWADGSGGTSRTERRWESGTHLEGEGSGEGPRTVRVTHRVRAADCLRRSERPASTASHTTPPSANRPRVSHTDPPDIGPCEGE